MLIWQKYLKVLGQVPSTLPSSTSKYQVLLNFKVSSTSKYQVLEILHQVPSIKYKYFTWPQPWKYYTNVTAIIACWIHGWKFWNSHFYTAQGSAEFDGLNNGVDTFESVELESSQAQAVDKERTALEVIDDYGEWNVVIQ